RQTVHFPDIAVLDPVEHAGELRNSQQLGFRATLSAPMVRDDQGIGAVVLRKSEAGAFSPHQIQLLESFAAQAVIAIENVRLFTELRQRTDDLTESLDQQTATADILRVISQSPTDVNPVLDAVAAAALRFCGAEDVTVTLRDGDELAIVAHQGPLPTAIGLRDQVDRSSVRGRSIVDG